MEVYNKEKTQIISDYDLSKGRLERDERTIYHEAVKEVVEQFHYEVVKEYENGGKDVEKVVDVKGVPGSMRRYPKRRLATSQDRSCRRDT